MTEQEALQALALLGLGKTKKPTSYSKGFAMVRTEQGIVKMPITPEVRASLKRFEGKQGSIRRSSKGRTRMMPNGYVRYNEVAELDVVSYVLR